MTLLLASIVLLAGLTAMAARNLYQNHRRAMGAKFTRAYRAASILQSANRHLQQYGTGRDFEYNNARHILLYAQDSILRDMAEGR